MVLNIQEQLRSKFLMTYLPVLLERFLLSYEKDGSCLQYFLYSKEKMGRISKNLSVSHDLFSNSLYIAQFYPELFRETDCRYLSAACFYLMVHHAVELFRLSDNCGVHLETEASVFHSFYSRLSDFNFKIAYSRPSERVSLRGHYHEIPFSTGGIIQHTPDDDNDEDGYRDGTISSQ